MPAVIYTVVKTVLAIGLGGAAVIGWMGRPLMLWQRAVALAAAGCLIASVPMTDAVGFGLLAVFAVGQWRSARVPA